MVTYERVESMPGGEKRYLHVKAVPNIADHGGVVGMYVVSHDITDVKQAQEQLAAREEELRFFAENIPEAIAYVDLERGCTFVNNLFLASRGLTREFALGRFPDQEVYPPDVLAMLKPHLERVGRGEETSYERFVKTPGGQAALGARAPHAAARCRRQGARLLRGVHRHPRDQDGAGAARRQGTAAAPGDRFDPHAHVLRGRATTAIAT